MIKSESKCTGSTCISFRILFILSTEEESGIPSVAVKCVDIGRNTGGEGVFLVCI